MLGVASRLLLVGMLLLCAMLWYSDEANAQGAICPSGWMDINDNCACPQSRIEGDSCLCSPVDLDCQQPPADQQCPPGFIDGAGCVCPPGRVFGVQCAGCQPGEPCGDPPGGACQGVSANGECCIGFENGECIVEGTVAAPCPPGFEDGSGGCSCPPGRRFGSQCAGCNAGEQCDTSPPGGCQGIGANGECCVGFDNNGQCVPEDTGVGGTYNFDHPGYESLQGLQSCGAFDPPEGAIAGVLCKVVNWFIGPVGQAIAVLAIIIIGLGALFGKASWGSALVIGSGIAIMFGAPAIVEELLGQFGATCRGTNIVFCADSTNEIGLILCRAANWFTGSTGQALAVLAVIVVGVGALLGKASWGLAAMVIAGISLIFGAASIVEAMVGEQAFFCRNAQASLDGIEIQDAQTGGLIGTVLCNVVSWFTGEVGRALAMIGVLVVGMGALFGRASWGMAAMVIIGIGLVFGSVSVVEWIIHRELYLCGP